MGNGANIKLLDLLVVLVFLRMFIDPALLIVLYIS